MSGGPATPDQIHSQYTNMFSVFKNMWSFRNFTGRGADADTYDYDDVNAVTKHIENSRKRGCPVGKLTAAQCKLWMTKGWYNEFAERYSFSPFM